MLSQKPEKKVYFTYTDEEGNCIDDKIYEEIQEDPSENEDSPYTDNDEIPDEEQIWLNTEFDNMKVNIDDSIALSSIIVKASKWSKTLYVLDSGASVHIFRENIIKDTSKRNLSQIRIKGVGGVNLSAQE